MGKRADSARLGGSSDSMAKKFWIHNGSSGVVIFFSCLRLCMRDGNFLEESEPDTEVNRIKQWCHCIRITKSVVPEL